MLNILDLAFLFALGSVFGWIIEFFIRTFMTQKKLFNPGFLNGPYLPLYGFGALLLYIIYFLDAPLLLKITLSIFLIISLELITGLIFVYYFKVRLWDYSKKAFNYKGIICPLYSFFWVVLSLLFYFFVYPYVPKLLFFLSSKKEFLLILGAFYSIFFVDMIISFEVISNIQKYLIELNKDKLLKFKLNYFAFKEDIYSYLKLKKVNFFKRQFLSTANLLKKDLLTKVDEFLKKRNFKK